MAGSIWQSSESLVEELQENPDEFEFYQVVRLLVKLYEVQPEAWNSLSSLIKIRPELNLSSAMQEIAGIDVDEEQAAVDVSMYGLYGASSPLPVSFTDELLDNEYNDHPEARGFVDILHYHLYPIFFEAWAKNKLEYNIVELDNDAYKDYLYAFVGQFGSEEQKNGLTREDLLKYGAYYRTSMRSSVLLENLLSEFFDGVEVHIEHCVDKTVYLEDYQRCQLGQANSSFDDSLVLGQKLKDNVGAFNIVVGPIGAEQYFAFVSDMAVMKKLETLIQAFLDEPLQYSIYFDVHDDEAHVSMLENNGWNVLGYTAVLGQSDGRMKRLKSFTYDNV